MHDAHPTDPTWRDLEEQFGTEPIKAIDAALSHFLSQHSQGIRRDDYYLVSEGLTYATLLALRESGFRFAPAVIGVHRKRNCPVCGALTTITPRGKVRAHARADGSFGKCPTSGLPEFRAEDDA